MSCCERVGEGTGALAFFYGQNGHFSAFHVSCSAFEIAMHAWPPPGYLSFSFYSSLILFDYFPRSLVLVLLND